MRISETSSLNNSGSVNWQLYSEEKYCFKKELYIDCRLSAIIWEWRTTPLNCMLYHELTEIFYSNLDYGKVCVSVAFSRI